MSSIKKLTVSLFVASTLSAGGANAQILLPQVELRGSGSTTSADALVRSLNCVGNPGNQVAGDLINNRFNKYGTNSGQLLTIEPGKYQPFVPSPSNPVFDCETQEIQPGFESKYVGIGSGDGRAMWRGFQTATTLTGAAGRINPFSGGPGAPSGWSNLQFALSEAPVSVSDLATYNSTANNTTNHAGAAIQVPFHVIPMAIAYNPIYGIKNTPGGPVQLSFNAKFPQSINGVVSGGIRLNKSAYCRVFNGEITNWNDPALRTLNGNTSLMSANDDAIRWADEGVTIQLVGRADNAGGTDVITRALAAQCGAFVTTNKFANAAGNLPFNNTDLIDIRPLRPTSRYFPTSTATNFSGPIQSLGGLVFDRITDTICKWDEVNATTTQCDASLAPGGVFTNARTPGLFLVADGSTGVAEAIEGNGPNALVTSGFDPSVQLRGQLGYIGADFVKPVANRTLFSAALQRGATTVYLMPSTANATAAFGTVLPPQASAMDPRTYGSVDPYLVINATTNPATPVSRANPLHWAAVIYDPNVPVTQTLASPANGYPITGVSFLLTYTCFKPANAAFPSQNAKRYGITEFMGLTYGRITKDSANVSISANLFKGVSAANLGILPKSNVGVPPTSWTNVINDTFLKKSTLNLWIQDKITGTLANAQSNPGCDPTKGA